MTVVIAGYNSERHLPGLAASLSAQHVPPGWGSLEVLYVDGGSSDESCRVAEQLGFSVVMNPYGDPIHAKWIGLCRASSRLVCFLDHDERLLAEDSLLRKWSWSQLHPDVPVMLPSGYDLTGSSGSNQYASEFGDPFSAFVYRTPNRVGFRVRAFGRRLRGREHSEGVTVFRCAPRRGELPLCEPVACGSVIDGEYFLGRFPNLRVDALLIPQLFFLLVSQDHERRIALFENDAIGHLSVESWRAVFRKVRWRAYNAGGKTRLAHGGYSGRGGLLSTRVGAFNKQWLQQVAFLGYALLVVPAVVDASLLALRRRNIGYLMHAVLALAVCYWVAESTLHRVLRLGRSERRYGM